MSLTSIQLCTIDPVDRAAEKFQVTVHSDDGKQLAIFDCTGEMEALKLRTAIREHADQLRRVADYRERKTANPVPVDVPQVFLVDVEGQARARFTTAEQAVKHAAKQVYACLDLQFSSQQLLEAGQIASWAYGFAGVTIYPPAKHGDAA